MSTEHAHADRLIRRGAPPAPAGPSMVRGSRGRALDAGIRALLEPRFAQDFSLVRVHDDSRAAQAAHELHARAFTIAEDVYFGSGSYQPGSPTGLHRIAHELAHVVQHRRGGISVDGESRAEQAAGTVLSGGRADPARLGSRPPGIARDPADGPGTAPGLGDRLRLSVASFSGFASGSGTLSPADRATVRWVASLVTSWLRTDPSARFRVVGNSADQGAPLASQRALAVVGALLAAGVPVAALESDTGPLPGDDQVAVEAPRSSGARGLDGAAAPARGGAGAPPIRLDLPPDRGAPSAGPLVPPLGPLPAPTGSAAPLPGPGGAARSPGPPAPRPGTMGDVAGAVVKVPAVADLIDREVSRLRAGLGRTTTGDRVLLGVGAATVAVTAAAGVVRSAELRRLAVQGLDRLEVPLAFLADARISLQVPGTSTRIGLDLGALGQVPNDVLRATTLQFRTRAPGDLRLPESTADIGFSLTIDLAKLPAGGPLR